MHASSAASWNIDIASGQKDMATVTSAMRSFTEIMHSVLETVSMLRPISTLSYRLDDYGRYTLELLLATAEPRNILEKTAQYTLSREVGRG